MDQAGSGLRGERWAETINVPTSPSSESTEEGEVGDSVEGCTQFKEDEDIQKKMVRV